MSESLFSQTEAASEIPAQVTYTQPLARVSTARKALIRYTRAIVFSDAAVLLLSAGIALFSRFSGLSLGFQEMAYAALTVGVSLIVLGFQGAYGAESLQSLQAQRRSITKAAPVVFALIAAFSYASKDQFSRGFLLLFAAIAYSSLIAERWIVSRLTLRGTGGEVARRRALTIGSAETDDLALEQAQVRPVLTMAGLQGREFDSWLAAVVAAVNGNEIDVVLLSQSHDLEPRHIQRLSWALEGSVDLIEQASLASLGRRAFLRVHSGVGFLHLVEIELTGPKRVIKRVFDIAFSTVVLILLSPLMLTVAVAVKLSSPGPVFFSQLRVGQHGKLFKCLKFRSMHVGAESDQQKVWDEAKALGLGVNKHPNDPRITRVGTFIRKWSLDELPQFINVLQGSMSVVGPRPIQSIEVNFHEAEHRRRLATKPGLTGLWQINGRSETTWEERMQFDVTYIEAWSLWGDILILMRTVTVILLRQGAI